MPEPSKLRRQSAIVVLFLRIAVGSAFILSGFTKMFQLTPFIHTVYKFNVLPDSLIIPFAALLPPVELALGIALVIGYLMRFSTFMIMVILLMFAVAVFPQLLGGARIGDCGCFGGLMDSTVDINLMIRDFVLLAVAYIIFIQKKHILTLDNKLESTVP